MTSWDALVQFTLHCDLSTSSGNPIINLNGISPCYSRCRYIARIIPDTRPSGSLRSRKIAPGDFFPPAGEDDGLGCFFFCGEDDGGEANPVTATFRRLRLMLPFVIAPPEVKRGHFTFAKRGHYCFGLTQWQKMLLATNRNVRF